MAVFLNQEKLKRCPFDATHKISEGRYKLHIANCDSPNRHQFVQCKYNAGHWLLPEEQEEHLRSCGDFLFAVQEVKAKIYNSATENSINRGSGYESPKVGNGSGGSSNVTSPYGGPRVLSPFSPSRQSQQEPNYPTTPKGYTSTGPSVFFTPPRNKQSQAELFDELREKSNGKSPFHNGQSSFPNGQSPFSNDRTPKNYRNCSQNNQNDRIANSVGAGGRNSISCPIDNKYERTYLNEASTTSSQGTPSPSGQPSSSFEGGMRYCGQNVTAKFLNRVDPEFNLLKPVDWTRLERRETFQPLTRFQIQTLKKWQRHKYHQLLMDWQKWKNSWQK